MTKFKKLIELLTKAQARRDKDFKAFHAFHKELTSITPTEVSKYITIGDVIKGSLYKLELTYKDVLWWEEIYKQNPLTEFYPLDTIKASLKAAMLDRLDNDSITKEMMEFFQEED
jgi:hypothetical protein